MDIESVLTFNIREFGIYSVIRMKALTKIGDLSLIKPELYGTIK